VLVANVRWLSRYRHPRCGGLQVTGKLVEIFAKPRPLFEGAARVGDRLAVLPVLYHLLWRRILVVDLTAGPSTPQRWSVARMGRSEQAARVRGPDSDSAEPRLDQMTPEELVGLAIDVADEGLTAGEMPVGAVVVMGDEIIGRAHTQEKTQGRRLVHADLSLCSRPTSGWAGRDAPRPWSWPSTWNPA
jgi:hypothetical protein